MIARLSAREIAALEQLGIALHLKDDLLTVTHGNGAVEFWLGLPGTVADYPGLEMLTISGRVFARCDPERPGIAVVRLRITGLM